MTAAGVLPSIGLTGERKKARMSAYELFLLVHIVAAMLWVGAAFLTTLRVTRAVVSREPARMPTAS